MPPHTKCNVKISAANEKSTELGPSQTVIDDQSPLSDVRQ